MGKYGDQVQLAWDEYSEEWVVIDVVKKKRNVILDIQINQDKTQLQVQQVQCALEYSGDPLWTNKIPLKKCPTGSPTQ